MPRQRPPRASNSEQTLLLVAFLAVFLLMGVLPLVESMLPIHSSTAKWLEWFRSRVMESLVALWFFVFGSMVGSFINVVVLRMPRGVSVVSSGSACPRCNHKIRLQDNIPIYGWIKLGGRCRVCRLPISSRYPIVEALFGLVFLIMFFVELQTAAANLPGGKRHLTPGILQVVVGTRWNLIGLYFWHMLLLVMCLTWTLMAYDRSRIPIKTVVFTIAAGFGFGICFPYLYPVKWIDGAKEWFVDLPVLGRMATGFAGLVFAFFLGHSLLGVLHDQDGTDLNNAQPKLQSGNNAIGLLVAVTSTGLFTGWHATGWIVLVFGVLLALASYLRHLRWIPVCGWWTLALLVFLCFWRAFQREPEPTSPSLVLIATGIGLALVALVSANNHRRIPTDVNIPDKSQLTESQELEIQNV